MKFLCFGVAALAALDGCGGTEFVGCFSCGDVGQPGQDLPEGGGVFHERWTALGMPTQATVSLYQFDTPSGTPSAPFPVPTMAPPDGNCIDERRLTDWPFAPLQDATFVTLPAAVMTGPGITGALTIPKDGRVDPVDPYSNRKIGTLYDLEGAADAATPGGEYTLDIGEGDALTYDLPESYTPPLGIGGAPVIVVPTTGDFELTWTAPTDVRSPGGAAVKQTYYNYVLFADPTSASPTQFICFPDTDGHIVVPAAVVSALPAVGLIVHAAFTHWQDARAAPGSDMRRFDLVGSVRFISQFQKGR